MNWEQRIDERIRAGGPVMWLQPIARLPRRPWPLKRRLRRVGYEALARFDERLPTDDAHAAVSDPEGRGFGPQVWFAWADIVGKRVELELAAVRNALVHLGRVPAPCYVSINCSPATIESARLRRLLARLPAADRRRVLMELTEHVAIDDYDRLRAALVRLAGEGVGRAGLAADDVGGGEASMRHVIELAPVLDVVKLDTSLTKRIDADPIRQELVRGIVAMGSRRRGAFGVIAEGIETPEQLRMVRRLRCRGAQGWHPRLGAARPVDRLDDVA